MNRPPYPWTRPSTLQHRRWTQCRNRRRHRCRRRCRHPPRRWARRARLHTPAVPRTHAAQSTHTRGTTTATSAIVAQRCVARTIRRTRAVQCRHGWLGKGRRGADGSVPRPGLRRRQADGGRIGHHRHNPGIDGRNGRGHDHHPRRHHRRRHHRRRRQHRHVRRAAPARPAVRLDRRLPRARPRGPGLRRRRRPGLRCVLRSRRADHRRRAPPSSQRRRLHAARALLPDSRQRRRRRRRPRLGPRLHDLSRGPRCPALHPRRSRGLDGSGRRRRRDVRGPAVPHPVRRLPPARLRRRGRDAHRPHRRRCQRRRLPPRSGFRGLPSPRRGLRSPPRDGLRLGHRRRARDLHPLDQRDLALLRPRDVLPRRGVRRLARPPRRGLRKPRRRPAPDDARRLRAHRHPVRGGRLVLDGRGAGGPARGRRQPARVHRVHRRPGRLARHPRGLPRRRHLEPARRRGPAPPHRSARAARDPPKRVPAAGRHQLHRRADAGSRSPVSVHRRHARQHRGDHREERRRGPAPPRQRRLFARTTPCSSS